MYAVGMFVCVISQFVSGYIVGDGGLIGLDAGTRDRIGAKLIIALISFVHVLPPILAFFEVHLMYYYAQSIFAIDAIILPATAFSMDKKIPKAKKTCIIIIAVVGVLTGIKIFLSSIGAYLNISASVWKFVDVLYVTAKVIAIL